MVGRVLAARLPARLIGSRLLPDPARALHPHGAPAFCAVFRAVRAVVPAEAAALLPETAFVFADALSDPPADVARFGRVRAFATARERPSGRCAWRSPWP